MTQGEGRGKKGRYQVSIDPDAGQIVIKRTDGQPCDWREEIWIKDIINLSLKSAGSLLGERSHGVDPDRQQFKNHITDALAGEHKRRRLVLKDVAMLMGTHPTTLSNFASGKSRSFLDVVIPWAYLLGYAVMLVPLPLRTHYEQAIAGWKKENEPDINWPGDEDASTEEGVEGSV